MATAPQKRRVSYQNKEATTGNHNWAQCRDKHIKGTQPQWIQLYHNFYIFMTLENIVKEQAYRSQDPEYLVAYKELYKQS